ncbi:uncharacterized protein BHQ10_003198 [Talaromyces amestolkiae]|uniref:Amidohydrolase-related domain-containing protein n=1 Tax=Talaromyces amestolkiae TaxID=1196081 RepID=A0A364KUF5_TALAM|nr:uncharacterized protein BHQ10_003198 [Talaromyces amestolkiae]RAO67186.1 hypothetical protein BHQ10_003198 [Talaromyces amestolkiae]
MTPIITLEEHYVSSAVRNASDTDHYAQFPPPIVSKLNTLAAERLQDLDNGHVSLQVISHGPGAQPPQLCKAANDELASAVAANPTRFAAFALLPMAEPGLAVEELERCVIEHRFVGALVDNHTNGQFYDDRKFWPVFEKAQDLDVPIYIHPSYPDEKTGVAAHYRGNYDDRIGDALGAYGWGWHSDTALSILKLYAAGLFDALPNVKIIIGHMGEMLPFQLERVIAIASRFGRQRGLRDVWTQNIWVTTSGMFALAPLACLLQTMPIERVLYSVDYPFSANEKGYAFLEEIKKSGLIKEGEEWEKFLYKNAQELLKVKV